MIYITGDTHGKIIQRIKKINPTKSPAHLIVCGDFGLLWEHDSANAISELQTYLSNEFPLLLVLFIDGNHENFDLLDKLQLETKFEGSVGIVSEQVFHLKRGEIYSIEGKSFGCFGGAVSVDKHTRIEGVDYWTREVPSYEEMNYFVENLERHGCEIDYLITHTSTKSEIEEIRGADSPYIDFVSNYFVFIKENFIINKHHYFGHLHKEKELTETHSTCLNKGYIIIE